MSVSAYPKSADFGKLQIVDGAGSPDTYTCAWVQGSVSISGLAPVLNEPVRVQVRGQHKATIPGARRYVTATFTAFVPNVVDGANNGSGTELEALLGVGAKSATTNTRGASAPWPARHLKLTFEGTEVGDGTDETIQLNHFEVDSFDLVEAEDGNTLSFSGTCTGTVVITNGSSGTQNTVTFSEHGYAS